MLLVSRIVHSKSIHKPWAGIPVLLLPGSALFLHGTAGSESQNSFWLIWPVMFYFTLKWFFPKIEQNL